MKNQLKIESEGPVHVWSLYFLIASIRLQLNAKDNIYYWFKWVTVTIPAKYLLLIQMSYCYNTSKISEAQDNHNQSVNSQQAEMQARAFEEEIELTILNYEALLQLEKKNSAERSEFFLFMLQSTRTRQQEEFEMLKAQL